MSVLVRSITVDCADPEGMAAFWSAALGWPVKDTHPDIAVVASSDHAGMPRLLFLAVPEQKNVKNRWHLDIQATTTMDAEVARLAGLGATAVRVVEQGEDVFTVMTDVEGNEFCVEVSPAERALLRESAT
jgi:predicted enzyme related to lactoylglutathione lyase